MQRSQMNGMNDIWFLYLVRRISFLTMSFVFTRVELEFKFNKICAYTFPKICYFYSLVEILDKVKGLSIV